MAHPISIVGGNIAGLSAAYHLARNGCPVTVFESRLWDKPCGGAISIEYANYLNTELGIDIPALKQPIPRIRFYFANQRCVRTRPLFVIVSRSHLQQQLIDRLRKEPHINIRIQRVSFRNSDFLSSQTVLATGFSGFTRRIIGRQWHQREYALAFKCQGKFSSPSNHPGQSMFFDSRLKGYAWMFCGSNGSYNAGMGGMKLFHQQIVDQIKKYPWFAMVHDGKKKIDFKLI